MANDNDSPYWGKHFLIDCYHCDKSKISSRDVINAFIKDLVVKIDMKAYGEPIIEHFATHDPSKGGYTACQMIETSLIDGHFVDETGAAYLSVHSCKDFDNDTVLAVIKEYFDPKEIVSNTVFRK